MNNTQSGKLRKASEFFAAVLAVAATAAIAAAPAYAQTPLAIDPAEPAVVKACYVVKPINGSWPWKLWQCNDCISFPILGTVCSAGYLVASRTNPAGE